MSPPRSILITGASSGIGRATASLLVDGGWQVIAVARRASVLAELAETKGAALIPMACDGGDGEAVETIAEHPPNFDGESARALVIEAMQVVDIGALVVAAEKVAIYAMSYGTYALNAYLQLDGARAIT